MQYACKKVRERLRTATKQILPSSYSPSSKTPWSKVTTLKDLKTMHRRQHLYSRSTCFSTFSLSTGVYNYSLTVAPASAPIHFNTGSACHTAPQCSSYARIQFFLQFLVCCKTVAHINYLDVLWKTGRFSSLPHLRLIYLYKAHLCHMCGLIVYTHRT